MNRAQRAGVTLVETLVAIGVIGLLASLSLPAMHSAREAARREWCLGRLKQIGIAMHNYEEKWAVLPSAPITFSLPYVMQPKARGVYFSAQTGLLAYLEQQALYNTLNFQAPTAGITDLPNGANFTSASVVVSAFLCPSDGASAQSPYGPSNFRANAGICGYCRSGVEDGAFTRNGVRLSEVADGTSVTLAFSEKLIGTGPARRFMPDRDWIITSVDMDPLQVTAAGWLNHCSHFTYTEAVDLMRFDGGSTWLLGGAAYSEFLVSATPNASSPDCGSPSAVGIGVFAARSHHPGGVNALMVDGSARFVTSAVNPEVWKALGTRAGGELSSQPE